MQSRLSVVGKFGACLGLGLFLWAGMGLLTVDAASGKEDALKDARAASASAVKWLLAQSNKDGSFGQKPTGKMPGVVGLALYAIATSNQDLNLNKTPEIVRAAEYLVGLQQENGSISIPKFGLANYNTSVSAMALLALKNPKYADVLEKAKNFILSCQLDETKDYDKDKHPRAFGGFGYGSAKRADLSNTQFSLEALKALGVKEDSPAFKNALLFVQRCQDNLEVNKLPEMKDGANEGGFVYLPGESSFGTFKTKRGKEAPKPYGGMTYAGIKALIHCGVSKDSPELQAAWKWVKNNYSTTENPGGDGTKGYYYYVVVMAKAMTAGGIKELTTADGRKVFWAQDLARTLKKLQQPNGTFANPDPKWMEDDQVLATSYALIALNLCENALKD